MSLRALNPTWRITLVTLRAQIPLVTEPGSLGDHFDSFDGANCFGDRGGITGGSLGDYSGNFEGADPIDNRGGIVGGSLKDHFGKLEDADPLQRRDY